MTTDVKITEEDNVDASIDDMTTLYPKNNMYDPRGSKDMAGRGIDPPYQLLGDKKHPDYLRELEDLHNENLLTHAAKMHAIYKYKGKVQQLASSPR